MVLTVPEPAQRGPAGDVRQGRSAEGRALVGTTPSSFGRNVISSKPPGGLDRASPLLRTVRRPFAGVPQSSESSERLASEVENAPNHRGALPNGKMLVRTVEQRSRKAKISVGTVEKRFRKGKMLVRTTAAELRNGEEVVSVETIRSPTRAGWFRTAAELLDGERSAFARRAEPRRAGRKPRPRIPPRLPDATAGRRARCRAEHAAELEEPPSGGGAQRGPRA